MSQVDSLFERYRKTSIGGLYEGLRIPPELGVVVGGIMTLAGAPWGVPLLVGGLITTGIVMHYDAKALDTFDNKEQQKSPRHPTHQVHTGIMSEDLA